MLYGHVEHDYDDRGNYRPRWVEQRVVDGTFDVAIVGYGAKTVNFPAFGSPKHLKNDLDMFNQGVCGNGQGKSYS